MYLSFLEHFFEVTSTLKNGNKLINRLRHDIGSYQRRVSKWIENNLLKCQKRENKVMEEINCGDSSKRSKKI
jgi:hypothetical protein